LSHVAAHHPVQFAIMRATLPAYFPIFRHPFQFFRLLQDSSNVSIMKYLANILT
jgi:hypothetical protein